jgi:hypothetical protein
MRARVRKAGSRYSWARASLKNSAISGRTEMAGVELVVPIWSGPEGLQVYEIYVRSQAGGAACMLVEIPPLAD